MKRIVSSSRAAWIYRTHAETACAAINVAYGQVVKAGKDLWFEFEFRNELGDHLLYRVKLQKAVPRFEVGLLFWRVVKLISWAWH